MPAARRDIPVHPAVGPFAVAHAVAGDIKVSHSVFALPFALLGAFLAGAWPQGIDWQRFLGQLILIVAAMVVARTVAMLANRLLDRHVDAANPRTKGRAIPSGRLSPEQAMAALLVCVGLFFSITAAFATLWGNVWPIVLSIPVLVWLTAYPLLKRHSLSCHLWLGVSLAISPIAAAVAIDPVSLTAVPALWMLAVMVACWVAGFDVIYALQDVDIDREQGLHSIPAALGVSGAIWVSRGLHLCAILALLLTWWTETALGVPFLSAIIVTVGLLIWEHATIARWGTTKVALAFFTLNGVIAVVLGLTGILDVAL